MRLRERWYRLVAFLRRSTLDREIDDEIAAHVDMATAEHMARGVEPAEARRRALTALGSRDAAKATHREARGLPSLDGLVQDVRYAIRGLRRSPGFTIAAVITLAVGIGVNAAVFTVVDRALFGGFPVVADNDRLLYISTNQGNVYYPDFEVWRDESNAFDGMALVRGVFTTIDDGRTAPETYFTMQVTGGAFDLLGVTPLLGRGITTADTRDGAPPVVVLRHDLWVSRFGADPTIIGRTLQVDGQPTAVVGVMPRGFSFPEEQRLWVPLVPTGAARARKMPYARYAVGRLATDASLAEAQAELTAIGGRLSAAYPDTNGRVAPVAHTFTDWFVGPQSALLYRATLGAVQFVLLIATVNVAILLLERVRGAAHELTVRMALGASRSRVIRHVLVEGAILAGMAGVAGAWLAGRVLDAYDLMATGFGTSSALQNEMNTRTIAYLVVVSAVTAVLSACAAAACLTRVSARPNALRNSHTVSDEPRARRWTGLLVAGEMAFAVLLLSCAGVMTRSFINIATAHTGVDRDKVLSLSLYLPENRYPDAESRAAFYADLKRRLAALPGAARVGVGSVAPMMRTPQLPYEIQGTPAPPSSDPPLVGTLRADDGYFDALGVRLIAGRLFEERDDPAAVLVNERFARRYGVTTDVIGRRVRLHPRDGSPGPWLTVVGVVSNVVQDDPTGQMASPLLYTTAARAPANAMFAFLRTDVTPETLAGPVQREIYTMDPALPVAVLMPLADRFARAHTFERNIAAFFLVFGAVALLLAIVGVYAVAARAVQRRRREIGIRSAVGATRKDILGLVVGRGMTPVAAGLAAGLGLSWLAMPVLRTVLVGVAPLDAASLALASATLFVAGALGCLIPAWRGARMDPAAALREQP